MTSANATAVASPENAKFGRYELLERIGVGGMAEVWKARVAGVGGFEKILVLKKILPEFAQNKTFVEMLLNEARLCAILQHANIVQTYENGEIDGNYYIAMEYVKGQDLFKVLSQVTASKTRIPVELCLYIAAEVAKGLAYAHDAKDHSGRPLHIIHRDVSPSNVLLSENGEVKVMDFGVARATMDGAQNDDRSRAGVLKGKLGYMSPEQVTGQPFDFRSDIFSLGIILYESITLKRLFLGRTDLETLVNIRDARIEHKFRKHSYIEEPVRAVLRKALARNPDDRYASALDFHDDIVNLLFQQKTHITNRTLAKFLAKVFATPQEATPKTDGAAEKPPLSQNSLTFSPEEIRRQQSEIRRRRAEQKAARQRASEVGVAEVSASTAVELSGVPARRVSRQLPATAASTGHDQHDAPDPLGPFATTADELRRVDRAPLAETAGVASLPRAPKSRTSSPQLAGKGAGTPTPAARAPISLGGAPATPPPQGQSWRTASSDGWEPVGRSAESTDPSAGAPISLGGAPPPEATPPSSGAIFATGPSSSPGNYTARPLHNMPTPRRASRAGVVEPSRHFDSSRAIPLPRRASGANAMPLKRRVSTSSRASGTRQAMATSSRRSTSSSARPVAADGLASPRNKSATYMLQTGDNHVIGPMSRAVLERMVRSRSAGLGAQVAVDEGPFHAIEEFSQLHSVIAELAASRKPPARQGTCSRVSFPRLFYRLFADRATGCLELHREGAIKGIYVRKGRPVHISTNQMVEMLGPFLVSQGIVGERDVELALEASNQGQGRLGDVLVAMNFIKPFELYQVLEKQLRAKFVEAFGWEEAEWAFYTDEKPPADIVPLDLEPISSLVEGVRQKVPLSILEPYFEPYLDRPYHRVDNPRVSVESMRFQAREAKAHGIIKASANLREALEVRCRSRQQRLAIMHVMLLLTQTDLVEFEDER